MTHAGRVLLETFIIHIEQSTLNSWSSTAYILVFKCQHSEIELAHVL